MTTIELKTSTKIDPAPTKSTILLIGESNARVGTGFAELMTDVVGKYSLGENNEYFYIYPIPRRQQTVINKYCLQKWT